MRKHLTISVVVLAGLAIALWGLSSRTASAKERSEVTSGRKLFRQYCASCHGADARGPGPVAAALKVGPPDLTTIQAPGSRFPTYRIATVIDGEKEVIAHGTRKMPVWGVIFRRTEGEGLKDARIYALVKYLESIQVGSN